MQIKKTALAEMNQILNLVLFSWETEGQKMAVRGTRFSASAKWQVACCSLPWRQRVNLFVGGGSNFLPLLIWGT